MITSIVYIFFQIIMMIILAPLVNGIINKVKALTQKRKGPPLCQMYYDLYKLLKKETIVSDVSSWIFKVTPYILFATAIIASLLVPISTRFSPFNFPGDFITLIYLLALGKFFMALAGLDTGSTFGGMGSSREMMISAITEPALMVSLFAIGLMAHSSSINQIMLTMQKTGGILTHPALILVFISLLIIIIAETSRIPVDDPATHLELTMVHEAMVLEYSGRNLALMELGAVVKQLIFITLLVNVFLPHEQFLTTGSFALIMVASVIIYILKVIMVSILIAVIEVSAVKISLFSVPNLAALSFIFSFIGFLQYFVLGR